MSGPDGDAPKKYGLILPKKNREEVSSTRKILPKSSIFDAEEDESDEPKVRSATEARYQDGNKSLWKKETRLQIQKALEEDPKVFEYDGIFDEMVEKKAELESRIRGKETEKDRKPKYVQSLMAAAKQREREFDRRQERKVQKEREIEGSEFAEKEAFVTSSYKKKLQEMREEEAREKELERIEARLDVTKQKDLSGFYRHLLKQSTGEEKVRNAGESITPPSLIHKPIENLPSSSKKREDSPSDTARSKRPRTSQPKDRAPPTATPTNQSQDNKPPSAPHGPPHSPPPSPPHSSPLDGRMSPKLEELPGTSRIDLSESEEIESRKIIEEEKKDVFVKRSTEDSTRTARERYLARQAAKAKQT